MSINCDLTSGWDDTFCRLSVGGIRRAIPVKLADIDQSSVTIVDNEITALTASTGGYEYVLEQNLSSYTASPSRTEESGSVFWDINLNMVLINDTKELRELITTLARNTTTWFVQKSSGVWVCLGLKDGLRLGSDNEGGSGVAKADRNGYSLSFVGQEVFEVSDVAQSVIDSITITSSI
jgi:hypothetical protein